MKIPNRRQFLRCGAGTSALAAAVSSVRAQEPTIDDDRGAEERATSARPLIVSTWRFGKAANERALEVIAAGGGTLDGIEQGIRVTESDGGNSSVGLSGMPDAAGVVQQDASIMWGPGQRAGSVAAVEGVVHPISVARRVMEHTKHVMLVGPGARWFAEEQGLEFVPSSEQEAEVKHAAWRASRRDVEREGDPSRDGRDRDNTEENHDTIALLVLDKDGNIGAGCSTSGWGGKLPGRVGDSPIIGSGIYVDNEVGAAGATGLGENVMRYCGSFLVVELMRQGLDPQSACVAAIERIAAIDLRPLGGSVNFVALDKKGRYGAAGSGAEFSYSVTTEKFSTVLPAAGLSDWDTGPEGGNRPRD